MSLAYPLHLTNPVLQEISISGIPKRSHLLIGGPGSGEWTLGQLLLLIYSPTVGSIFLDDQEWSFLDEDLTREHVAADLPNCTLFDMSVHNIIAMGLTGPGSTSKPQVGRTALMHEFVHDLPMDYDSQLGTSGVNLSGGQTQRLDIACAFLRNPTDLILGKHISF